MSTTVHPDTEAAAPPVVPPTPPATAVADEPERRDPATIEVWGWPHSPRDAAALHDAGVPESITQGRDQAVPCNQPGCRVMHFNIAGGCDRDDHYRPPGAIASYLARQQRITDIAAKQNSTTTPRYRHPVTLNANLHHVAPDTVRVASTIDPATGYANAWIAVGERLGIHLDHDPADTLADRLMAIAAFGTHIAALADAELTEHLADLAEQAS